MLGVTGLVIAERLKVPSIAPLMILGVLAGPDILGLVDPRGFGPFFPVIVKLGVAIIIFEGAMTLSVARLKPHFTVVRNLVSLGFVFTLAAGATLFTLVLSADFVLALLFGALVAITGPTVVQPLLRRVPVSDSVSGILRGEAIMIEPVGILLAALIFEIAAATSPTAGSAVVFFLHSVAVGCVFGIVAGWLLRQGLRFVSTREDIKNLAALAVVLGSYGAAETLASDSGILTVALAGLMLSGTEFAGKASLKQFKGQITLLTIAVIFVLISAGISLDSVARIGWRGAVIVAVLVVVIRPVSVFLCTSKSRLTTGEKAFLASVAPRGIVSGSVASLFAIQLAARGHANAEAIVTVVFMTIGATVLLIAPLTRLFAQATGVFLDRRRSVLFVGAHAFSRLIARKIAAAGCRVSFVDTNPYNCAMTRGEFEQVTHGSALDEEVLMDAGAAGTGLLLAFTENNETNILVTQFARREFQIPRRALILQLNADESIAKHVADSDIKVAFGGRFNLPEWVLAAERDEITFVRFTTERDIPTLEPLVERVRSISLPVYYEEGDILHPVFRSSRLPAGTTIQFAVKQGELERLEGEFKQFCAELGGAKR